ncbi:tetratricopeptide repeat protein [Micavibrio aeruginosavorus]|uniref:Occlusion derived virus envelope protein 66 n=1 Tax=Micavibrio aeruginosavorus EPB TaxID=349215 RepID=M4VIG0_9BACT|nr:tetratricopeptide repeat protein [Micavibrio aeruginosavorus]AGH98280.1 occlusion derived virus envelope protein 66 [Micavibrio aeruginosavorus EPB]
MAKNDILSNTYDSDLDDMVLDMMDDDDDILELQKPVRAPNAGRRILMSTVAVVALAGAGLGYLATAGAQQMEQVGGKIVTELSALDAADVDPVVPDVTMPDVTVLSRVDTVPVSIDGAADPAMTTILGALNAIEPASGGLGAAGVPNGPDDVPMPADELAPAPGVLPAPAPAPAPAPSPVDGFVSAEPPASAPEETPIIIDETVAAPAPDAPLTPEPVAQSAPEPTPEPIILGNDEPTPPMPDLTGLEGAPDTLSDTAAPPPSATISGRESASGVTENRVVAPAPAVENDVYYDSAPGVPTGPLSNTVGPRKVDPTMEPASTMVIVQKDYGSGEQEAMVVAAGRALDLGRYESALEMYDTLYKKNKSDIRILMGRAVAQQNVGYRELAIQSYEEVLKADPKNADAVINMMGILRDEYPSVALRRLLDLKERHPANSGLMAQIGMTYAAMGQTQDAVRSLNMAASMDPRNASHLYNLAILFDRAGDSSNAMKYYEQALETDAVYGGGRSIPRDQVYDRLSTLRAN